MLRIAIYDPPGCCSTGVCDPGLSDQMTQFATAIDALMKSGHDVARFNMARNRAPLLRTLPSNRRLTTTAWIACH